MRLFQDWIGGVALRRAALCAVAGVAALTSGQAGAQEMKPGLIGSYYEIEPLPEDATEFPEVAADVEPDLVRVEERIEVESTAEQFNGTGLYDHFLVRFVGKVRAPKAGTYQFHVESDDGSRLKINGKTVVDNGGLHGMNEVTGEVELAEGVHDLVLEYFENSGDAGLKLSWTAPGEDRMIVPAKALFHDAAKAPKAGDGKHGLLGKYYDMGQAIEDFPVIGADTKPALQRVDARLSFDVGDGAAPGTEIVDYLYVKWTGKIRIPKDGKYTFHLTSDDGSRLSIGGNVVVDHNGLHGMEEKTGEVELKAGDHDIVVEFFENEGQMGLKLQWSQEGKAARTVPSGALIPPAAVN